MIVTAIPIPRELQAALGRPCLSWHAPAGWEDMPPPSGSCIVIDTDGRALGRLSPISARRPHETSLLRFTPSDMANADGETRELRIVALSYATALRAVCEVAGGAARLAGVASRWQMMVLPGCPLQGVPPATLDDLRAFPGFERE